MNQVQIIVLDFGSQYTQLIARRLREHGVYTEIVPYFEDIEKIKAKKPKGIILSGGPASVYERDSYKPDNRIFELGIPILGICYGMQYIAHYFGGKVIKADKQEFGKASLEILEQAKDDEVVITEFNKNEYPQIAKEMIKLWEESVKESYDFLDPTDLDFIKEEVYRELNDKNTVIVASNKEDTLGFISGSQDVLKLLYVSPHYRYQSVGKKLLLHACNIYLKDYEFLYTSCFLDNTQGLGYFKKLGFKAINIEITNINDKSYPIVNLRANIKYLKEQLTIGSSTKNPPILRTPHTNIREMHYRDLNDVIEMLNDNSQFCEWKFNIDSSRTNEWLNIQQENYKKFGFGMWVLEDLEGNFIGQIGLNLKEVERSKEGVEVAFIIKKKYWGISYVYDALKVCIDYAFNTLKIKKIYSTIKHNDYGALDRAKLFNMCFLSETTRECEGEEERHLVFCLENSNHISEIVLETRYTLVRKLSLDDNLALQSFFKNPNITEHNINLDDNIDKWISNEIDNYDRFGCGYWVIIDKTSNELLGVVGLHFKEVSEVNIVVTKEALIREIVSELSIAIRDYLFKTYNMKEFYLLCKKDSHIQHEISNSIGFVKEVISNDDTRFILCCVAKNTITESYLFNGVKKDSIVWMSHADKVEEIPDGFVELAKSGNTHYCAIANLEKDIYALQFHPEVVHSEYGSRILRNFAVDICGSNTDWNMKNFAIEEIRKLRNTIKMSERDIIENTPHLTTERLTLRKFEEKDIEDIYSIYGSEHSIDFFDEITCKSLDDAKNIYDNFYNVKYSEHVGYYYAMCLQDKPIGFVHINIQEPYELRFAIKHEYWYQGYSKEAIEEIIKQVVSDGTVPYITASHRADSKTMGEVLKSLGMQPQYTYTKTIQDSNNEVKYCFHQLDFDSDINLYVESGIKPDYSVCGDSYDSRITIQSAQARIKEIQPHIKSRVLCAVSGGVDSSVVATLLYRAIGENLIPVFVDTGLLRAGEREAVEAMFRENLGVPLITVDASEIFLGKLKGVTDPEVKRKIIGETFIEVFEAEAKKHNAKGEIKFLAQGTLYPDVIESVSVKGPSKTIKSHHNVGGLPEWMKFELIEPLRELFKDEVRALGRELGMPEFMLMRHPFPGPGLAIRIMGEVNKTDLDLLRACDSIFIEELHKHNLYNKVWQAFCVLLNVKSVGVMGDNRTYDNTICVRAVEALDGMTATFSHLPHSFLEGVANRIINEVEGINRVVYDITSKPPGTIEWE